MPDDRRVTASFGLAFTRQDEPMKRLIRRADVALYAAKDAGRNRLRIAEGDSLPDADENMILPRSRQKDKPISKVSLA
ncbi:MAG: diguanylate cyclase [Sphingomonadales bacterium]|nr:diguanylate cyclase [Sphingomonadales bacterium]